MSLDSLTSGFDKIIIFDDDPSIIGFFKSNEEEFELPIYGLGHDLEISDFIRKSNGYLDRSFIFSDMDLNFGKSKIEEILSQLDFEANCNRNLGHNCCLNLGLKLSCTFYQYLVKHNFPVKTNFTFITANQSGYDDQIINENRARVLIKDKDILSTLFREFPNYNPGEYEFAA